MKAYSYPFYVEPYSNFVSKIKDVSNLFDRLCKIGVSIGADMECIPSRPSCKMVFWKAPEYAVIIVNIFEGKESGDDLIVEMQCISGDRSLFRDLYASMVNTAIKDNLVDAPEVTKPRSLCMPQGDEVCEIGEEQVKNIFDMFECEFFESRLTAGYVLYQVYKNCRESDKEMIRRDPRLVNSLKVLLSADGSGVPDVKCATICLVLAVEMKVKIETDVILKQKGIMWKEAQRQSLKLENILTPL